MTLTTGRKYIVHPPSTRLGSFSKENGFHTVTPPRVALPGPGVLLILSWQSWCFHTKRLEQMENGQTFAQFGCEKILSLNSFSLLYILLAR